jgi:hypothetical protein
MGDGTNATSFLPSVELVFDSETLDASMSEGRDVGKEDDEGAILNIEWGRTTLTYLAVRTPPLFVSPYLPIQCSNL